jgi:hypothetical protein
MWAAGELRSDVTSAASLQEFPFSGTIFRNKQVFVVLGFELRAYTLSH